MRRVLLTGLVCLLAVPLVASAQEKTKTPSERLAEAESEFRQGQYRSTVDLLKPLIYPRPILTSVDDLHRAREVLGAAYWHLGEKASANKEWERLLGKRPGLVLDEFTYPLPMRQDFDRLRDEMLAQGAIEPPDEPKPPAEPTMLTRVVERQSRALTFMPFGVAQFDQGEDGWGYFFATGQGVSGAASLGSLLAYTIMQYQQGAVTEGSSEHSTQRTLMLTTAVSGAVFYVLYTWGVIDANVRHQPERVVEIVPATPADLRAVDTRLPQPGQPPKPGGAPSP